MSHTVYSINEEEFRYDDLEEAIEMLLDNESESGDTIILYSGTAEPYKFSDFMRRDVLDDISEHAYEEAGEWAGVDLWPDVSVDQEAELMTALASVANQWADKHQLQPTFYKVTDIKEIKMIVIDPARLLCRIVE